MSNITSAQVFSTADQLVNEGKNASFAAIREKLGSGSKSTILKYLQQWRNGISKPVALAVPISPTLNNALANELTTYAAAIRAEVERNLSEREAELAALMKDAELLERERDELRLQLQEMTTDRDTVSGKATQQEIEMTLLSHRLEREQSALSDVQVQLAMEKLKLVDLQKRDVDQLAEIQRQADLIQAETKARIAAEQLAAVLATKLDYSLILTAKADASTATLSKQMVDMTSELQAARIQIQTLQNEHSSLTQKFQASQLAAQEAIGTAKQADRTAAELRGRLDSLQERSKFFQGHESANMARPSNRVSAEPRDQQDAIREGAKEGETLE